MAASAVSAPRLVGEMNDLIRRCPSEGSGQIFFELGPFVLGEVLREEGHLLGLQDVRLSGRSYNVGDAGNGWRTTSSYVARIRVRQYGA